mgnify:CR=1 FL=1
MNHYPLFADLNGRPVLLAGAGKVAERKAESLLQAGAAVRVVARELNPVFQKWADEGKIEWLGSEFHEDDLDGVFFAVALYLAISPLFAAPRTATVSFDLGIKPFLGGGSTKGCWPRSPPPFSR